MKKIVLAAAAGILAVGCGSNPAAPGKEPTVRVAVVKLQPSVGATVGVTQRTSLVVRVDYDLGYGGAFAELVFHNSKDPFTLTFTVKDGLKQLPFEKSGTAELVYDLFPGLASYGVRENETVDYVYISFMNGTHVRIVDSERIPVNWRFVR